MNNHFPDLNIRSMKKKIDKWGYELRSKKLTEIILCL